MARVKGPTWEEKIAFERKMGIPMEYLSWETKRAYVRRDGVFRAIGWLMHYGSYDAKEEDRIWYFLAD
tara:strand:+ start:642 stop:845 length:204 start_codon:yes stop_codon:yes gene_type:complete